MGVDLNYQSNKKANGKIIPTLPLAKVIIPAQVNVMNAKLKLIFARTILNSRLFRTILNSRLFGNMSVKRRLGQYWI